VVESRVLRGLEPGCDGGLKLLDRHSRVRQAHHLEQPLVPVAGQKGAQVTGQGRLDQRVVCERRLDRRASPEPVQGEGCLEGERILGPESAVVVEDGDPLRLRHSIGRGLIGHAADKVEDRLLGDAVVPGGQGISRGHCASGDRQHRSGENPGDSGNRERDQLWAACVTGHGVDRRRWCEERQDDWPAANSRS